MSARKRFVVRGRFVVDQDARVRAPFPTVEGARWTAADLNAHPDRAGGYFWNPLVRAAANL